MEILVLPDSYKGSMSSKEACDIASSVLKTEFPEAKVVAFQVADGGEGTCDALIEATDGKKVSIQAPNAEGRPITTYYGQLGNSDTAIIEVAKVIGYTRSSKSIFERTTYGVGHCIKDALDKSYQKIIVSTGGSSTNDAGIGLLIALGVKFYDKSGKELNEMTRSILEVHEVDYSGLDQRLKDVELILASDVSNQLLGKNGASFVFGPQKGLNLDQIHLLEKAFKAYANLVNKDLVDKDGSGSAGGIGYALLTLGAKKISGAELLTKELNLNDYFKRADIIITGEGKTDTQTFLGKLPFYIATEARAMNRDINIILISGSVDYTIENLYDIFDSVHSISNGPITLEKSMQNTKFLYEHKIKNIATLLKAFKLYYK